MKSKFNAHDSWLTVFDEQSNCSKLNVVVSEMCSIYKIHLLFFCSDKYFT